MMTGPDGAPLIPFMKPGRPPKRRKSTIIDPLGTQARHDARQALKRRGRRAKQRAKPRP